MERLRAKEGAALGALREKGREKSRAGERAKAIPVARGIIVRQAV